MSVSRKQQICPGPLSGYGTYTTVKLRIWPWPPGKSPEKVNVLTPFEVVPSSLGSGWWGVVVYSGTLLIRNSAP